MLKTVFFELNGNSEREVPSTDTIIQACMRIGMEIPRFCYQEQLMIAGNCRMCLVEIGFPRSAKPIASCAMPVGPNMKIFTNTMLVKKARESVLEFLLINHPLDCPICDQGGECDLQDETMIFGSDRGRFYETKRCVEEKELGPVIKTVMNRCIHCTRCVRYFEEIAGLEILGTMGRGSQMEIGTLIENLVYSEISGNVIDLCPVGALTSKPYTFQGRPWELRNIESIDVLDSFRSSIRLDVRGSDILRILPLTNVKVNEEWISDRTRFFYDGLKRQRIYYPFIRGTNKYLVHVKSSWEFSFSKIKKLLKFFFEKNYGNFSNLNFFQKGVIQKQNILGFVGKLIDCESILIFKDFLNSLGSSKFFTSSFSFNKETDFRFNYTASLCLDDIKQKNFLSEADLCLLVNFNPRLEMPILNIKLRQFAMKNNILFLSMGSIIGLNFFCLSLSNNSNNFVKFFEGKNFFCRKFLDAKKPIFLIGNSFTERYDCLFFQNNFVFLAKFVKLFSSSWFGVHFFENFVGKLNSFELGFVNTNSETFENLKFFSSKSLIYLLGFEFCSKFLKIFKNFISIYQGHNADENSKFYDIILPSTNFTEKNSTFINYEGFTKFTKRVTIFPFQTRDDWRILLAVFSMMFKNKLSHFNINKILEKKLSFFNLDYIRRPFFSNFVSRLNQVSFTFKIVLDEVEQLVSKNFLLLDNFFKNSCYQFSLIFHNWILNIFMNNPFMNDPVTKCSITLSLMLINLKKIYNGFV